VLPVTSGPLKSLQKSRVIQSSCYEQIFAFISEIHDTGICSVAICFLTEKTSAEYKLFSLVSRTNPTSSYTNEPDEKGFGYYCLKSDLYTNHF